MILIIVSILLKVGKLFYAVQNDGITISISHQQQAFNLFKLIY